MAVRAINNEARFQSELTAAGSRLVVVNFTAAWCDLCQRTAPHAQHFEQLPSKYPRAVFLKIDIDKCQKIATAQGVSAKPTFIFYRNKFTIDRLQGANVEALEAKIVQYIGANVGGASGFYAARHFGQLPDNIILRYPLNLNPMD